MPPKPVYKVASPFQAVDWPRLSPEEEATVLAIVLPLLSSIGAQRTQTKRARSGKRKRTSDATVQGNSPSTAAAPHVTVGLNAITRHLESILDLAPAGQPLASDAPSDIVVGANTLALGQADSSSRQSPRIPAVVLLPEPRDAIIYEHLPVLALMASRKTPSAPPTRLVHLHATAETKLAAALALPRAGAIAIFEGESTSAAVIDYVREHLKPVEIPWLAEMGAGKYLELKVDEGGANPARQVTGTKSAAKSVDTNKAKQNEVKQASTTVKQG